MTRPRVGDYDVIGASRHEAAPRYPPDYGYTRYPAFDRYGRGAALSSDVPSDRAEAAGHRGRGPKGYVRSDRRIEEDVSECLADSPAVDASEIEVRVQAGEVTLSGTIGSRRAKHRAEDLVASVRGVTDVRNRLRVRNTAALLALERPPVTSTIPPNAPP